MNYFESLIIFFDSLLLKLINIIPNRFRSDHVRVAIDYEGTTLLVIVLMLLLYILRLWA